MSCETTEKTAQYFYAAPPSTSLFNSTLTEVGNNEYWDVSRTITSDPIKIRLYWETQPLTSLATDCSTLTVAHFKGGIWQQESSTMQSGLLSCLLGSSGSIETDWVNTFSPFGFGGSGGGSLPIKLVSFDAVANGNIVETNWVTRLEINNAYFTLERSSDAENWQEVAQVQGAGNSTSILRYQQDDLNPIGGTSYYRLKQTDFDGQFTYSDMVQVHLNGAKNSISVFPNPTSDVLNIHATNSSNEIKVEIFDLSGRKMFAQNYAAIN